MFIRASLRRTAIACAISVELILTNSSVGDEVYRDNTNHFSFRLPTQWSSLPSSFVDARNEEMALIAPEDSFFPFQGGFGRSDRIAGSYPYVLFQTVSFQALTGSNDGNWYEQLQEQGVSVEGPIDDVIENYAAGTMVLDRSKNRLVMHQVMDVDGVGTVRDLAVGMLGKNEIVYLHCYALDADVTRLIPTFNVMLDSFEFDPGFALVATPKLRLGESGGESGVESLQEWWVEERERNEWIEERLRKRVGERAEGLLDRLINVIPIAVLAGAGAAILMHFLRRPSRNAARPPTKVVIDS